MTTKSVLLGSSLTLFGTRGYQATSVKDITTHAGLAVGAFYTHFRSKRDPLVALMRQVLDRISHMELRPPTKTTRQLALRAHFQELFREDDNPYLIVRAWHEAVMEDDEIAAMHSDIVKWTQHNIVKMLHHLRGWPNARAEGDLDSLASIINTYMWTLLERTASIPPKDFQRQVGTIADIIYFYLFRDRASTCPPDGQI